MARKSKLNDSAELYTKREKQTEKQKLKDMNLQEKIQYFKDYYLKLFLLGGLGTGFLIWIIVTLFSPKTETVLYAAILNDSIEVENANKLKMEFGDYLEIDKENQAITLDTSFYISNTNTTQTSLNNEDKLATFLYVKQIDILIADPEQFEKYTKWGYMVDLREYLPSDLYSQFSDSFYISSTEDIEEEKPYGIYLDKSVKYKTLKGMVEKPILGIVVNSKYKDNATEFLRFLHEEN